MLKMKLQYFGHMVQRANLSGKTLMLRKIEGRRRGRQKRMRWLNSITDSITSSQVWMWELDYEESWALKNWWFWTVVLEKTLESPLDCKEIQPVHPEGNQSWIFIGKSDTEAKLQYFGHLIWRTDSLEKTMMIGKMEGGRRRERERMDEMVGWHHWLDGHEFEQAPGVSDGQGSLACCSPWGCKESDTTEQLNNNNLWFCMVQYGNMIICAIEGKKIRVQVDLSSPNHVIKGSNGAPPQYSPLHPSTNDSHLLYRLIQKCPKWCPAFHLVQFPHNSKKIFLKHKLNHITLLLKTLDISSCGLTSSHLCFAPHTPPMLAFPLLLR